MARVYEDKKSGFKKAFNIITNILYVIVMIILIIFIVYGFESLASNKVPSFFGQSYVRIMSGSMEASGFEKGDVVMIKKVNLSNIQEGDIIAFYSSSTNHPTFIGEDELDNIEIKDFKTGKASFDTSIIFHKINDIQYDSEGNTYFQLMVLATRTVTVTIIMMRFGQEEIELLVFIEKVDLLDSLSLCQAARESLSLSLFHHLLYF